MPDAQLESEEQPAPASWPVVAGAEHVPAVSLPAGTEQDPTQTLSKWIETCESLCVIPDMQFGPPFEHAEFAPPHILSVPQLKKPTMHVSLTDLIAEQYAPMQSLSDAQVYPRYPTQVPLEQLPIRISSDLLAIPESTDLP